VERVSCGCAYIVHEYPTSFQLLISACHPDLTELALLVLILDAVTLAWCAALCHHNGCNPLGSHKFRPKRFALLGIHRCVRWCWSLMLSL